MITYITYLDWETQMMEYIQYSTVYRNHIINQLYAKYIIRIYNCTESFCAAKIGQELMLRVKNLLKITNWSS